MERAKQLICLIGIGLVLAQPASACPVCNTDTGKQVRTGVFNRNFGANLLATLLPFPIFLGITALLYYGPPRRRM